MEIWVGVIVFNATFNNISAISWLSVSLVEEALSRIEYSNVTAILLKVALNNITLTLYLNS
jgi:hypothetical protein